MARLIVALLFACVAAGCSGCKEEGSENNDDKNSVKGTSCEDAACDENASCDDSSGEVVCTCVPGYEGDGFSCTELMVACQSDAECGAQGTCTDGFCECGDGYALTESGCADADECATNTDDCDDNATCTNTDGGFSCACDTGWEGDGKTCSDFDECAAGVDDCSAESAVCENVEGGFECACESGFTGDGVTCSILVDCNADPSACDEDATCTETPDGTACVCDEGFSGDGSACSQTGFTTLSAASDMTCGLRRDGTMACWGFSPPGGQANGLLLDLVETEPIPEPSGGSWSSLASTVAAICGIRDEGTIWCAFRTMFSQVGMQSDWAQYAPAGTSTPTFQCAIKTDRTLWCWGQNNDGQVGDGTMVNREEPTQVGTQGAWESVAVGANHACAVKDDGGLWCWGNNSARQLGDDGPGTATPRRVGTASDWADVVAADGRTCAFKENGQLYCTGRVVEGLERTGTENFVSFDIGQQTECGVTDTGKLYCTGANTYGARGDDEWMYTQELRQVGDATDWKMVTNGFAHTCALKESGAAYCWGSNYRGQLGVGTSPIKSQPTVVSPGTSWTDVAPGQTHTLAIRADGTLWGTGGNGLGQLGIEAMTLQHTPRLIQLSTDTTWVSAGAGLQHSCAVKSDGTLFCAGHNGAGQVGTSSSGQVPLTQVDQATNWSSVALGPTWSCGLKSDGALYCWGDNQVGQLGFGDTDQRQVPTRVGIDTWAALTTNGFSTQSGHSCAISSADNSLWCWGNNAQGQLGIGSEEAQATEPTQAGGAAWNDVSAGGTHTCGIQMDGSLWCWGADTSGQLGLGSDFQNRPEPARVGADSDWADVSAGANVTCAAKETGALFCWGDRSSGITGSGSGSARVDQPLQVGTSTEWETVTTRWTTACATRADGSLWCWGQGREGQLGHGDAWTSTPLPVMD